MRCPESGCRESAGHLGYHNPPAAPEPAKTPRKPAKTPRKAAAKKPAPPAPPVKSPTPAPAGPSKE